MIRDLESRMAKRKQVAAAEDPSLINRYLAEFEKAKRTDANGKEYWLAREYADILGYTWEGFGPVIEKGKASLLQEGVVSDDQFRHVSKLIVHGKGGTRDIGDIELSRRACYHVGINGDPRKKAIIAAVQTYFVIKARKQEIHEEVLALAGSDTERLEVRRKLAATEQELDKVASPRLTEPVEQLVQIRHAGQKAFFNAAPSNIKTKLGVPEEREIADYADPLIVSGMQFATAITVRTMKTDESVSGAAKIKKVNKETHTEARAMLTKRGIIPERLRQLAT